MISQEMLDQIRDYIWFDNLDEDQLLEKTDVKINGNNVTVTFSDVGGSDMEWFREAADEPPKEWYKP